jgi:hypothetical protein
MTLREAFYAGLYRDLLSADHSAILVGEAVWPPISDVPRFVPADAANATTPCIVVCAKEKPHKHPDIRVVELFIRLQVNSYTAPKDGADAFGTPTDTVHAWCAALQQVLENQDLLRAQLLSLPESARTGSVILRRQLNNGINHVIEEAERAEIYEMSILHDVDTSATL